MLKNIQALRFFAAFAVVIYHSSALFRLLGLEGDAFLALASYGDAGVDVFFVISGYVMWYTTRDNLGGFLQSLEFARRRLYRIYLGYWPAFLFASFVIIFVIDRDLQKIDWLRSVLLLNPTPFNQVLGVAWTLAYELYFYALFALLLLVPVLSRKWILIAGFALVLVVNLSVKIYQTPFSFVLSPYLLEFLAGALLGAFLAGSRSRFLLIAAVVLAVGAAWWGTTLPSLGFPRVKGLGVAAASLVLVVVILENARLLVAGRQLVFLGSSSYSLYLLHTPVLWCFLYLVRHSQLSPGPLAAMSLYLLAVLTTVVVAAFSYRYVEAPLYKYALQRWQLGSGISPQRG